MDGLRLARRQVPAVARVSSVRMACCATLRGTCGPDTAAKAWQKARSSQMRAAGLGSEHVCEGVRETESKPLAQQVERRPLLVHVVDHH